MESRKDLDRSMRKALKKLDPETEKLMQERDIETLVAKAVTHESRGWGSPVADEVAPLHALDDPRAVDLLVAALKDEDWETRANAANALGILGDPHTLDPLAAALQGDVFSVQYEAITALQRLSDSRAVDPLRRAALEDDNQEIRDTAASALETYGERP